MPETRNWAQEELSRYKKKVAKLQRALNESHDSRASERTASAATIAQLQAENQALEDENSKLRNGARGKERREARGADALLSPPEKKVKPFQSVDVDTFKNSGSNSKAWQRVHRRSNQMQEVLDAAMEAGKFNVVGDGDGDGRDGVSVVVEDFLTSYIICHAGSKWVATAVNVVLSRSLETRGRGNRVGEFALDVIAALNAALDGEGEADSDSPFHKIVKHVAKGVVNKISNAWDGPHTVLIQKTLGLSRLKLDQLRRLLSYESVGGDGDEASASARKWMPKEVVKDVAYPMLASRRDVDQAVDIICKELNIRGGLSAESAVVDVRALVKNIMRNLIASRRAASGDAIQFILEGDAFRVFRGVSATNVGVRIRMNGAPFPQSSREWYPILLTEGADKYEVLQESLRPLMDELRTMLGNRLCIELDDSEDTIVFNVNKVVLLGGDMPFVHEVLAQRGATHTYGCIYCVAPSQTHLSLVKDAIHNKKTQLPDDIKLRSVNDMYKWAHLPYMRDDGTPEPMLCDACNPPKQFTHLCEFQNSPDDTLSPLDVKTYRTLHFAVFPGRGPMVPFIHTSSEDDAPFLILDHVLGDPLHLLMNEFNRLFHHTINQHIVDDDAEQKWYDICKSLGTARSAQASEKRTKSKERPLIAFTGNEVNKVLDNLLANSIDADKCLLSLVQDPVEREKIKQAFEALDSLMKKLLSEGSTATDVNAHADEVGTMSLAYAEHYLKTAALQCSPYLHYLVHHLPDQVRKHGPNYAQYSQQASESSHKDTKGEYASPLCISAACQTLNTPSPKFKLQS